MSCVIYFKFGRILCTLIIYYKQFWDNYCVMVIFFSVVGPTTLEWAFLRSEAPPKQCLFSISPASEDFFSTWLGLGAPLSRDLEGVLYKLLLIDWWLRSLLFSQWCTQSRLIALPDVPCRTLSTTGVEDIVAWFKFSATWYKFWWIISGYVFWLFLQQLCNKTYWVNR